MYEVIKRIRDLDTQEIIRDVSIGIVDKEQQAVKLSNILCQREEIRNEKKKNVSEEIYYIFRELSPMTTEMYNRYIELVERDIKAES